MEEVSLENITIDRCTHCQGLWFDVGEAQQLLGKRGSEALDAGDPAEGWKWDNHADISCPRCGKHMNKSADLQHLHIWYETCDDHGMFMDAGEFTDFKHETLIDWLRGRIEGDQCWTS